jgi:hypothetical protein
LKAWEAIMSSPIHLDEDTDPALIYAPPWARERIRSAAEATLRSREGTPAAAKMSSGKLKKPKFSGDRAMLELQRQLALDPDLIPEPSSAGAAVIRPFLIRLCSVNALAAVVAWGLVSYSGERKTVEIVAADTSATAIASNRVGSADGQPLRLWPPISQTAEVLTPVGKPPPLAVATADARTVTPAPVSVTAPAVAETPAIASAPPQRANDRRPSRPDSDEIAILVKRGKDLLADGDLAAARLLLRRAAEAGSADGAFALGTTFDPLWLQRLGAIGAVPDQTKARQWYQRAAELGSSAASQQLADLGDPR